MDGVIYHGNIVLLGGAEFINWLNAENKEYLFLTNNSSYTPRELRQNGYRCDFRPGIRYVYHFGSFRCFHQRNTQNLCVPPYHGIGRGWGYC